MLNLEISDSEYIIKLDKASYTLSSLQNFLNKVQDVKPICSLISCDSDVDVRTHMEDRFDESYDHLSEK